MLWISVQINFICFALFNFSYPLIKHLVQQVTSYVRVVDLQDDQWKCDTFLNRAECILAQAAIWSLPSDGKKSELWIKASKALFCWNKAIFHVSDSAWKTGKPFSFIYGFGSFNPKLGQCPFFPSLFLLSCTQPKCRQDLHTTNFLQ